MNTSLSDLVKSGKRRLVIAYNPHSSRHGLVEDQVFSKLDAAGLNYEKLEVKQASLEDNVKRLKTQIKPNDIVLSAAGDGSAHAVAHSVIAANKKDVSLGFLAFGNFNDLPKALNSKKSERNPVELLKGAREQTIYPLEVEVDNKPLRKALLYATFGWTAQAASRFDDPGLRGSFVRGRAGVVKSLWHLGLYYLKSRGGSRLNEFKLNGKKYSSSTDVLCMNGPTLARLFRVGRSRMGEKVLLYRVLDVQGLFKNIPFLIGGVFSHIKGQETKKITATFSKKSDLKLQCDGEVVELRKVEQIIVQKSPESLIVLTDK